MRSLISWMTSRSRVIASVILLTLGLMATAALDIYLSYQRASAELVVERDRQLAYLSAGQLQEQLAGFAHELDQIARTPELYRSGPEQKQAALGDARHRLAMFDGGVVLLDNFGKVAAASPERTDDIGEDWSGRDFFPRLLTGQEVVYADAVAGAAGEPMVVAVAVPVRGDRNEFVGALAGMFRLSNTASSAFYASIVRLRLGQSGNTYVVDGAGRILYDSGYREVGELFAGQQLAARPSGTLGGAVRTRDAAGNEIVAAYALVPGTDWLLVVEDDWSTLTTGTQRYSTIMFALIAGGMALPVFGVLLLLRQRNLEVRTYEGQAQEAQAARLVQRSLLPRQAPVLPGWTIYPFHRPAGGERYDLYDFMFLADGRLLSSLVTVHERGAAGASAAAVTLGILHSAAQRMLAPAEALDHANQLLCADLRPGASVACVYAILDPANARLELANAGQPPAYHTRYMEAAALDGADEELGQTLDARYRQQRARLAEGEQLLLYSRDLIASCNPDGEPFGAERLVALLSRGLAGADLGPAILFELDEFTRKRSGAGGDLSFIIIERLA